MIRMLRGFVLVFMAVLMSVSTATAQKKKKSSIRGAGLGALVGQLVGGDTEATLVGAAVAWSGGCVATTPAVGSATVRGAITRGRNRRVCPVSGLAGTLRGPLDRDLDRLAVGGGDIVACGGDKGQEDRDDDQSPPGTPTGVRCTSRTSGGRDPTENGLHHGGDLHFSALRQLGDRSAPDLLAVMLRTRDECCTAFGDQIASRAPIGPLGRLWYRIVVRDDRRVQMARRDDLRCAARA